MLAVPTSTFIIIIIITSNDDIQPSTVVSNQLPSGLVLVIYG